MTPQHASHSSIELWLNCGKRYQLQKIQRVPEPPAWYLIGGSAVHKATEWLDKGEQDDPSLAWEQAFEQEIEAARRTRFPEDQWLTGFAVRQREDHWREKGLAYTQQWVDRAHTWDLVEADVSQVLPSGVEIKAYVDRIRVEDAVATIWDLKTSSKRPETDQQLGIYRVLVEKKYPWLEVKETANYMFKDDKAHEYDTSRWTLETVDELAQQWMKGVGSDIFIPRRSSACSTCSMRTACYIESGDTDETRRFDPLNPSFEKPPF